MDSWRGLAAPSRRHRFARHPDARARLWPPAPRWNVEHASQCVAGLARSHPVLQRARELGAVELAASAILIGASLPDPHARRARRG
jgi:hypothetical protein